MLYTRSQLQQLWLEHARAAGSLYPPSVWRVINAVIGQSKQTQTKVLNAVKPMLSSQERQNWPTSRRQVDAKLLKSVGSFHSRVVRRVSIDLSHIGFPQLRKPIEFAFLDPVFTWANTADKLSCKYGHTLYFKYQSRNHPVTGEDLYGASVQNGKIMRKACERVPTG